MLDPSIIQKLNLIGAARAAGGAIARRARVTSNIARQQAHIGYHVGRQGHIRAAFGLRHPPYRAGIVGGYAVRGAASARDAGTRVGRGLRAGYAAGRNINTETADAVRRAYELGSRNSLVVGHAAGRAASAARRAGNRIWVTNRLVTGGGYWRRVA